MGSVFRPSWSSPPPALRMFLTHWVSPRGATRYRCPSKVRRLTGTDRHSPEVRPRTRSTREPTTLMPSRVRPALIGLKTFLVDHLGARVGATKAILAPAALD